VAANEEKSMAVDTSGAEPAERSLGTATGATHGDAAYGSPGFCTPLTQPCSR
jgi:hypothetical protein